MTRSIRIARLLRLALPIGSKLRMGCHILPVAPCSAWATRRRTAAVAGQPPKVLGADLLRRRYGFKPAAAAEAQVGGV